MTSQPRRKRKEPMDEGEAHRLYPSLKMLAGPIGKATEAAWVAAFAARPDSMHSLLADFIKQAHATPGRIGQRPMPKEEQVDLQALLYGELTDEPMVKVLPELVTLSERAMCAKVHMSKTQWRRVLSGDYEPDVKEIRTIADALGKPAAFFVEYRKAMVVAAVIDMLNKHPRMATSLYRRHLEIRG